MNEVDSAMAETLSLHRNSSQDVRHLTTELVQAVKCSIQADESLIDYLELARRMQLTDRMVRRLKNAGLIRPVLDLGKIVRFHWPSVLAQLQELNLRRARSGR